jgi:hypothetical protein
MHWIAPSEKDAANGTLEKRLCQTRDLLLQRLLSGRMNTQTN